MGWLSHILLGDLGQSVDIMEARDATRAQSARQTAQGRELRGQAAEIARLKQRTEQLHLALTALTRYLIDSKQVSAAELADFIRRVDIEDGDEDGRLGFSELPARLKLRFPKT